MFYYKTVLSILICTLFFSGSSWANNLSQEDLLESFKSAYSDRKFEKIIALYRWEGVDNSMRMMVEDHIRTIFLNEPGIKFTIEKLDKTEKTEYELDGFRYSPNVKLLGYITITHDDKNPNKSTSVPFGIHGKEYYLSNMTKTKLKGNYIMQKQLGVSVIGMPEGNTPIVFTGEILYKINGKPETRALEGKNNISLTFRADTVEKCVVSRKQGKGELELIVSEDGKPVFKSSTTSFMDIVYKKED